MDYFRFAEVLNSFKEDEETDNEHKNKIDCYEICNYENNEHKLCKEKLEEFIGTISDLNEDEIISKLILDFVKKYNLKI